MKKNLKNIYLHKKLLKKDFYKQEYQFVIVLVSAIDNIIKINFFIENQPFSGIGIKNSQPTFLISLESELK